MEWDVVVIGGGHAGCEAAAAAGKMGCKTALVTLDRFKIGMMSCNPAIGGLAKGQLVKEIDALGGVMGMNTDKSAIQYRRLNSSKGPAVRSSRAQCDRALYAKSMQEILLGVSNLTVIEGEATAIGVEGSRVKSVILADGTELAARSAVVTAGTFLRGVMFTGFDRTIGGRAGDRAANGLSGCLEGLGFQLRRLKTGTPPRLEKASIDYTKLVEQPGDTKPVPFSFYFRGKQFPLLPQVGCWITYTNKQVHEVIRSAFDRSPLFTGVIRGVGPRYCPSIEDKVRKFSERERHQLFIEPEGLDSPEVYVNGISTSLPRDVQEKFVRLIPGLENARFVRYGYAVEYDSIDSRVLKGTLESKDIGGLFFAGQINGTSGYEEAGAQGLIAGINAVLGLREVDPFVMSRSDGYTGVMIDDLVVKGTDEPYRMFTSRAEYRLLLREDNADLRLSDKGWKLGLLSEAEYGAFCRKRELIAKHRQSLREFFLLPNEEVNGWFAQHGLSGLKDRVSGENLLRRPEVGWNELCELGYPGCGLPIDVEEQVEIQVKYEGYVKRDVDILMGMQKNETLRIPKDIVYEDIPGLSSEIRARFKSVRPETIGQAGRMTGVTPAAVANLMIFLKMREQQRRSGGR